MGSRACVWGVGHSNAARVSEIGGRALQIASVGRDWLESGGRCGRMCGQSAGCAEVGR